MEGAPLPQRARGYWKAQISAARERVEAFLETERAQLPPWAVVGFGTGIAAWFALDTMDEWLAVLALASGIAIAAFAIRGRAGRGGRCRRGGLGRPLWGCRCVARDRCRSAR